MVFVISNGIKLHYSSIYLDFFTCYYLMLGIVFSGKGINVFPQRWLSDLHWYRTLIIRQGIFSREYRVFITKKTALFTSKIP